MIICPQTGPAKANTTLPMVGGQSALVRGVRITAHAVMHNTPTLADEVTTAEGYRTVLTGDAQTSTRLPVLGGVDLFLLNGWINGHRAGPCAEDYNAVGERPPVWLRAGGGAALLRDHQHSRGSICFARRLCLGDAL